MGVVRRNQVETLQLIIMVRLGSSTIGTIKGVVVSIYQTCFGSFLVLEFLLTVPLSSPDACRRLWIFALVVSSGVPSPHLSPRVKVPSCVRCTCSSFSWFLVLALEL